MAPLKTVIFIGRRVALGTLRVRETLEHLIGNVTF